MTTARLNVIALVSGGKDSFFSILHCMANGHRIVALANLHPSEPGTGTTLAAAAVPASRQGGASADHSNDHHAPASGQSNEDDEEVDLNSFMYQTVGHQVIPHYAAATGLPLFRQPIVGTTVQSGISYQDPRHSSFTSPTAATKAEHASDSVDGSQFRGSQATEDETESLVPLLRAVIEAHPEANALCTGAILSTYQRTRIESVALRLGLVPIAYLWQYPALPIPDRQGPASILVDPPSIVPGVCQIGGDDDAQLLRDMSAMGLDARIIKVASAGLDEGFLWENVASDKSIARIKQALRRFGGGGRGSVLGEGGEFETLVIDGPSALFKGRIVVGDTDRRVVHEGGGSTWLSVRDARVEMKSPPPEGSESLDVRIPTLLDARFRCVHDDLQTAKLLECKSTRDAAPRITAVGLVQSVSTCQYEFMGEGEGLSVEQQTTKLVEDIRRLGEPRSIVNTVIILRKMSDFPIINKVYGDLFAAPNPPSRVTISCGTLLPEGSQIGIYVTIQHGLTLPLRQGLHVQSRSYWAPANIGPYSQAIVFPQSIRTNDDASTDSSCVPKLVTIAGQIPLLPASMELPQLDDSAPLQITLALQHLWRVGIEMQTQWWTSAVAYFPRTPDEADMKRKALLAACAWQSAHLWSADPSDEDDENGPDLWDRKYNPQYMSLTSSDDSVSAPTLPLWDRLNGFDEDDNLVEPVDRPLPYVYAAEVEELPRGAGVEWHAHRGLVNVSPGSIHVVDFHCDTSDATANMELQNIVVDSTEETYIHTTAALSLQETKGPLNFETQQEILTNEVRRFLGLIMENKSGVQLDLVPYLTYVNKSHAFGSPKGSKAIIPCHSLWNSKGQRLEAVMHYQVHLTKTQ
ncbi:hypothetical protein BKA67DRAFT_38965 [Truncatella angustata]|uniref:Diphthine--ammonia ligase n=1 Tax=Truncatella angustata TaxID=152316 RepID=A0A9P8UY49_9PEZI|nr:uncharacterized protein BKA67DRAFT_38965 [Truncatella angustata]KAH6660074.1 hypothetical protein BKA67DRAFT_38965 [Truncatella angustata]KAH8199371.1 hypothetical protein TruAng_006457 [Truncatella angustata]